MIETVFLLMSAVYLSLGAFAISTNNFTSGVVFKFIPFIIAIGLAWLGLTSLGVVSFTFGGTT